MHSEPATPAIAGKAMAAPHAREALEVVNALGSASTSGLSGAGSSRICCR